VMLPMMISPHCGISGLCASSAARMFMLCTSLRQLDRTGWLSRR
jgi:hypothetical protein